MKDKIMKFMGKNKETSSMSDNEKKAKMSVLQDLRSQAASAMGDKLNGLKKVTVASNDPKGLQEGLEKAKELTQAMPGTEVDESAEPMEDPAEEDAEIKALSTPEECDAQIEKILARKAELEAQQNSK